MGARLGRGGYRQKSLGSRDPTLSAVSTSLDVLSRISDESTWQGPLKNCSSHSNAPIDPNPPPAALYLTTQTRLNNAKTELLEVIGRDEISTRLGAESSSSQATDL